jgi:Fe-S oxidoreductase
MWLEHESGQRINDLRLDEIQELGPDLAVAACRFCLIMLEESATARGDPSPLALMDIAEVSAAALAQADQPV